MTDILTDLSTPALVRAIRQSLFDLAWSLRDGWKQAVFEQKGKVNRWSSPIPMGFIFNAAVSTRPPEGDETDLIRETVEFFRTRQKKEFDWWLTPGLETSDWGGQLEAHGLKFQNGGPGMGMDLSDLPDFVSVPENTTISIVGNADEMKTWAKIFTLGYELPPDWEAPLSDMAQASLHGTMKSYIARVNGQPAATSAVFYDAGVAGIYKVATLPEWRGKGLGAAVTLQPLLDAKTQGYRAGILQSSEKGYKVYQRLGFKELCRMDHYHWQEKE